jgi:hypothetical protein
MLVIFSKVKLLPTLPVIFVVDKVNELPVDTKKLALTVGEITYNFIGAAPVLVNLPYLKLPVENVPAPGDGLSLPFRPWIPAPHRHIR